MEGNSKIRFDKVLFGGEIVLETGVVKASLGINDGKIAAIMEPGVEFEAKDILDISNRVVFPGLIDPHVHLWEPGPLSYREDFLHGTQAAAAGGVTTVIEMPLSVPPVIDQESFEIKYNTASDNSVVDFALWGGLIPSSVDNLEQLHELGCVAFKAFMSYANDDYPHTPDHYLLEAMEKTSKFNGLIGVHAENADVVDYFSKRFEKEGIMDPEAHSDGRPIVAEMDAIQRAVLFAESTGCRLYIVHMTAPEGGEVVRRAKERGAQIYNETCPHYLIFDKSQLRKSGSFAKCNPPLRSREDVEKLWEQIFKGNVDCIGSDHGPYTDEEKLEHGENIWKAPSGFAGIELILPIMITEGYHNRGLSLDSIAKLTATKAAKIFDIYPRKGSITIGSDADLAIVDLNEEWVYTGEKTLSKTKSSKGIYEGLSLKGKISTTLVRGEIVYDTGKIQVSPGYGAYIAHNHKM